MSIYKSEAAKAEIMRLYDAKLAACNIETEDLYVDTFAGKTHILATGAAHLPPLVVLHGINAGAPLALEAIRGLNQYYRIYGVDTVGQATKSAETRLPLHDTSYGKWLDEVMEGLGLKKAPVIGISYGAFLLQRLMMHAPERIEKGIFVVPSGFVNGPFWKSMRRLSLPLMRFLWTKQERDLLRFLDAYLLTKDPHSVAMQKALLLGVKMDYRRPPLLQAKDVERLNAPVYGIFADDDIFFPGDKALERCQSIFKNFKDFYILKNSKHIPDQARYGEIEGVIKGWLGA